MFTDFIETVVMVVGGLVLGGLALNEVGGYSEMVRRFQTAYASAESTHYPSANLSFCNRTIPPDFMHLMRPADGRELPWSGMTIGLTFSAIWYWCTDQGNNDIFSKYSLSMSSSLLCAHMTTVLSLS